MLNPQGMVVAIITVLLVLVVAHEVLMRDEMLTGLWVGDPGAVSEAGLSDFVFYLGPRRGRTRAACLLMVDTGGGVVASQTVTLQSRWYWPLCFFGRAKITESVVLHSDEPCLLPRQLKLTFSPPNGTLLLHDDKHAYAFCYRDNAASLASQLEEELE